MNASNSWFPAMRRGRLRGRTDGFTLIELMITVAIVAILAAVAYPSYMGSVWKGRRGEAKAAILRALQAEERWFTQNNTYVEYTTTPPSGAFPAFSADNAGNSQYTISVRKTGVAPLCTTNDATQCVIVTATVVGRPDPVCGTTLSMDTVGNKTSAIVDPKCWQ